MLKFHKLTLKNFMSYGNKETHFYFNQAETKLVCGENLDAPSDGGVRSNGAGKTVIVNGISYALFGKPVSKIKKVDKLINIINKKKMFVAIEFEANGVFYKAIRARKMKAGGEGNFVKLYRSATGFDDIENENNNISRNNDATSKDIERVIGISYDVFIRSVLFSANKDPFLSLPENAATGASQVNVIETLFGLTELSHKADYLKKVKIKDNEVQLKLLEQEHALSIENITKYNEMINNTTRLKEEWNVEHQFKITKLNKQIKNLSTVNFEEERQKFNEIQEKNNSWVDIKHNITNLENEKNNLNTQLSSLDKFESMINSAIKKVEVWDNNTEENIRELKQDLNDLLEVDYEQELIIHKNIQEQLSHLSDLEFEETKTVSDLTNNRKKLTKIISEIEHLKDESCPYCHQYYESAKEKLADNEITYKSIQKEIEQLERDQEEIKRRQAKINEELEENYKRVVFKNELLCEKSKTLTENKQKQLKDLENSTNPHIESLKELKSEMPSDVDEIKKEINAQISSIEQEIKKLSTQSNKLTREINNIQNDCLFKSIQELQDQRDLFNNLQNTLDITKEETNPHINHLKELKKQKPNEFNKKKITDLKQVISHQKMLHKLLTKKDSYIRKFLQQKNIPYLNKQISGYNSFLGLPHKVEFTDDMSVKISLFDRELDYGNLSSGQQALLDISIAFAFRDVLQKLHTNINLWIVDEALDGGLDDVGITKAALLLKRKAHKENTCLLVVSHRDELKNSFDKNLTIVLDKGFSHIKEN